MPSDVSVLEMHILITRIILITNSILITFVLTLKSQRYNFKLFFTYNVLTPHVLHYLSTIIYLLFCLHFTLS